MSEKTCKNCGGSMPKGKRPHSVYCSEQCGRNYRRREFYRQNLEKEKVRRRDNNSNLRYRIHSRVKSRAKREGITFSLDREDIEVPDRCPVLGIRIQPNQGRKGYHPDSPSLDRIDPSKGYVPGNVRVVSARANLLKNDAELWELEAVLSDLRSLKDEDI